MRARYNGIDTNVIFIAHYKPWYTQRGTNSITDSVMFKVNKKFNIINNF